MPMPPPKSMYPYPPPNQPRNGVGGYSYEVDAMNQGRGNDAIQIGMSEETMTDKLSKIQIGGVENHNDVSTEQIK
jgi:hypothetical protein